MVDHRFQVCQGEYGLIKTCQKKKDAFGIAEALFSDPKWDYNDVIVHDLMAHVGSEDTWKLERGGEWECIGWKKAPGTVVMTDNEYVYEHAGKRCPVCKSLVTDGVWDLQFGVNQKKEMSCDECGATWIEMWSMDGYEELERRRQ